MLQALSITKQLGHHRVLQGLDLFVDAGETVVIFGANGAGKTTLIRILSTLLRPDQGEIYVRDHKDQRPRALPRDHIGLISHEPLAYLSWTPYQNLRFLAHMYRVSDPESRILHLLDYVGLLIYAHEPLQHFSRGMTQRFMIARALIHNPPLLLFDEPFSGLDIRAQEFVTQLIKDEKQMQKGILLTTHVTALGYAVGDRYLVLTDGRLESLGCSGELSLEALQKGYQELLES